MIPRLPALSVPRLIALPVHGMPRTMRNAALQAVLGRIFREDVDQGALAFLEGASIGVEVTDAGLRFQVRLEDGRLRVAAGVAGCALQLKGGLHDFLLLATRREDADTLFFQRRLKMQGDTELGLELKNFLDGLDLESRPLHRRLDALLQHGTRLYERLV